ncbi:membrane cofactor protein-like isoform X5 [Cyprinus carpio]|uniref:Membrane cofactor protein-like isoform X5 n=1 Tax=Cyprinus carpio TaxID=7962 RepID=A0A9R0AQD8_CYPCA|nr:membrane cofactor protein-like isoform X5 [Cyprinus carpio]
MAFMLLNLCAPALFLCLLKAGSIRAQCTQPDADLPIRQSFPDGSTVTFECVIGHRPVDLEASRSITCQGNQWTSLELSCSRKSCGNLANFFHGRYEVTGNLFGDTAKPVCDKGYMLVGKETTRTCRDQGWDGRDPLCEPVKCSAPPAIENGQLEEESLESYDYLNAVSYRCNRGLNLIGQSTLHCSEDGTFKPDPPKCVDGCPVPTIPNGKRIGGKSPPYKLGNFVEYKCEDGYTMKGEAFIVCRANGWDPEPPTCIGKSCGNLADFFHGRYEVTGNLFGDTAKPVCDKGYMLAGKETTRTCRDQGWDGRDPLCEPVKCSAPPAIENGQLEDEPLESYDYLEAVTYRCNKGLNLIGNSTLRCSEDGTFKPDPPKCFDGCPVPTIPNAKRIDGRSPPYKLGNFIEYKCEDGYTMKGEAYIVCRANGWDPAPPRCIAPSTTPSTATTTTNAVTSTVHTTSKALKEKDETKTNTKDSSMSIGAKVGIALGVVGLVVIGGVSLVYFMKRPS